MDAITLVLLILGAIFFILAMVPKTTGAFNWVAAGLFCWILTVLLPALN
jgi:hypothetical protein